ncbi:MAG: hypothetical protein KGZ82_15445 [Bacteroidales bacterium]|nr:hypothetical protein [Bacteroidales bacterium]
MHIREIERLLEKFYNGETSLQEEALLREWFASAEIPSHLASLKAQFAPDLVKSKAELPDEAFDEAFFQLIDQHEKTHKAYSLRKMIYAGLGLAASLAIMLSIYLEFKPRTIEDTFNDPALAYEEVQRAMLFVSSKLNKGMEPVRQGTASFNAGMEKASDFNKMSLIKNYFKIE